MRKSLRVLSGVVVMSILMTCPAFAGQWVQEGSNWKYQNDDGSYAAGNWQWIDGKSYCFDGNGIMYANTTTPDGYTVNENGAWTVNGAVQTQNVEQNAGQSAASGYKFGNMRESEAGTWVDPVNLTWKTGDGTIITFGRGPKYSDLHPEVTDREHILKDTVWYLNGAEYMDPNDPNYWSSKGETKLLIHYADEYERLRTFVNSFDWIHADEMTRMTKV